MTDAVAEAVARGDLDELVRLVDGLCDAREWPDVVRVRDRCRQALERGLQLWPAAEYAEYRLALHSPGPFAGPVVVEGAGRFALGPLWEVAASTHDWASLEEHLPDGPARAMAAHERVVRGEDLGGAAVDEMVLELPLRLVGWEPAYPPASYRSDKAEFPTPPIPSGAAPIDLPEDWSAVEDEESVEALYDLGRAWVEQSNGSCAAVAVEGGAMEAIAALGHTRVRVASLDPGDAVAWMAWAAASGGAYGRRAGTPAGRFAAWWALTALTGLEWPPDPAELGEASGGLEWFWWEPPGVVGGWALHLAVSSSEEGLAWAVAATDTHREDDPNRPEDED